MCVVVVADGFAVDYEGGFWEVLFDEVADFGELFGDVVEVSREELDLTVVGVDLDSKAVVFVVEDCGFAGDVEAVLDCVCSDAQHGFDGFEVFDVDF